jgi:putative ABC transport system ATP-binding protein
MASTVASPAQHVIAGSTLVIDHVSKSYAHGRVEIRALADASLEVTNGEFVAIMGPSGSGKSTLLGLIAGLDVPTRGAIYVRGACISSMGDDEATAFRRRHIGMIYQHFNLFPDLTIEENVAVPLLLEGRSGGDVTARVHQVLERVGLYERRDHLPTEVSGGEVQRAAIARALVTEPAIILADEPTGNLDSMTGERILTDMRRAADEERRTIVLVTHDPIAAGYADRTARLRDGAFEAT